MRDHAESGGAFLAVAALTSFYLCFLVLLLGIWGEEQLLGSPSLINIKQVFPLFIMMVLIVMEISGVYRVGRKRLFEVVFSIFVSVILINLGMLSLPIFDIEYIKSPYTVVTVAALQFFIMCAWAYTFHRLYFFIFPKRPTIVVADNTETAEYCADKIHRHSREFMVVKAVDWDDYNLELPPHVVTVAFKLDAEKQIELQKRCIETSTELCVIPALWELNIHQSHAFQFGDILVLRLGRLGFSSEVKILKRVMDIVVSVCAILILFLPVCLLAAIIFLQDGRNPIYSQDRLTKDGRVFRLYKLRTMIVDAEKISGPALATYNDPRITRFGRFLRRTRLDELTQFFNVLKGDMSVVGPRPERPAFHNLYLQTIPEYKYRLSVKAGITGMAHVYGRYDTCPEERIKLDLHYILSFSFLLDIKLMIETVRIMFSRSYAEGLKGKREEMINL